MTLTEYEQCAELVTACNLYRIRTVTKVEHKQQFYLGRPRIKICVISIGLSQAKIETAKNALTMNLSIEQVATLTGLSPEEIEKL